MDTLTKEAINNTALHGRKKDASEFAIGCKLGNIKSRYANINTTKAGSDGEVIHIKYTLMISGYVFHEGSIVAMIASSAITKEIISKERVSNVSLLIK